MTTASPKPNTTPIPNILIDDWMADMTLGQLKTLLYITRRTYGFQRPEGDAISLNQMINGIVRRDGRRLDRGTGLSKPSLLQALRDLKEKGFIEAEQQSDDGGNQPTKYRLVLEETLPPLVKEIDQGGVNELSHPLGKPALPPPLVKKVDHTKDSNTGVAGIDSPEKESGKESSRASLGSPPSPSCASHTPGTPAGARGVSASKQTMAARLRAAQQERAESPLWRAELENRQRAAKTYGAGNEVGEKPLTGSAHKENKLKRVIDLVRAQGFPCPVDRERDPKAVANSSATTDEIAETYCAIARGEFGDQWTRDRLSIRIATEKVAAYQIQKVGRQGNTARHTGYRRGVSEDTKRNAAAMELEGRANYYGLTVAQYREMLDNGIDPETVQRDDG